MFPCEYGVTLKASVLKNICERLLLHGRHWYSTSDILKFYYRDKMEVSPFSFSLFFIWVLFLAYKFFSALGRLPPSPKLTLRQTLALTGGQFSSGAIVWLSPNPKTSPDLDPKPIPKRRAIFLGGQLSGYYFLLRNLYIYARILLILLMYEAVFKCNKICTSFKLILLFPSWLEKCGVWFDV